jgi:TPR repeat protein
MPACFATGVFRRGYGEESEALVWGLLAAQRGHAEAQLMVGRQYLRGEGAPRNLAEAERWLSLAAQKGQERAQAMLEVIQREKLGV